MKDKEYPEGHDVLVSKGQLCPKCQHDNAALYADGHMHCFTAGCGYHGHPEGDTSSPPPTQGSHKGGGLRSPGKDAFPQAGLAKRRINKATLLKFGVFLTEFNGTTMQVYPYYSKAGDLVLQKLRDPNKDFPTLKAEGAPKMGDCKLFGQQVWGDRFDRQLIITEGELDALSVSQALDHKVAVVSVNSGAASAAKLLKANYLWVDRFEDIVLWLDNDEPGLLAMEECAKLFKVGKVRIAKHPEFKDASDCLQADLPGDIKTTIYAATKWSPKGIVNAADNREDVMKPKEEDSAFSFKWPWQALDAFFGPILPGQMVVDVAGTGVGKTTFIYHIVDNLVKQGARIGFFSFEGTRREIKLGLLTVVNGKRIDLEPLDDDTMGKLHDKFFGSRQIELFDPETAEWNLEAIEGYLRYCAKALDCQVMFIDPLSFMVAGMDQQADERRGLDLVSRNLAAMAKELGVHIHISHHLSRPSMGPGHEEGAPTSLNQIRGSGGIAAFATIVIGHERNQQAPDDASLLTQIRGLKNRPRSKTGIIMVVEYDLNTGRLSPSSKQFPKAGSKDPGARPRDGGFGPAASGDDY